MSNQMKSVLIIFAVIALILIGCPSPTSSTVLVTGITITAGTPSDGSSVISGVWTPLSQGATLQLTATVSPSNASDQGVTWSASSTANLSVSATGLLTISDTTGNPSPEPVITATIKDGSGKIATFSVNLSNFIPVLITGITISAGTPSDGSSVISGVWTPNDQGATLQLTANISPSNATNKTVTWSSNYTTGYLSISATGLITIDDTNGDPSGGPIITATANDGSGKTATFSVNLTNWG